MMMPAVMSSTWRIWRSAGRQQHRAALNYSASCSASAFGRSLLSRTPNASRVIASRDLADVEGARVVESYFDAIIRPRPPRGVVLFAPCSFNSLNKLACGIADNLVLSIVAEAIGRRTPVIVAPSLNQPLLAHPAAQRSLRTLGTWGVTIVPPVDEGDGPRLASTADIVDTIRPFVLQTRR